MKTVKQILLRDSPDSAKYGVGGGRKNKNLLVLVLLITIWYISAILAITTSRRIMLALPLPNLLCTLQFVIASIITKIALNGRDPLRAVIARISTVRSIVYKIAVSYTLGFVFTNFAFSIVPPSFAETVKSAEPFSSVLMAYFYFYERTSTFTYLTLIPICAGVGISCVDDSSFNSLGFTAAAASNFCFSSRAVLAKQLFRLLPPESLDSAASKSYLEVSLFYYLSRIGLLILIPLTIMCEGADIIGLISSEYRPAGAVIASSHSQLLVLFIFNGCAYSCYNLASFLVMSRTDLVTHAVLNVFRRVAVILFTAWFFSVHLSWLNLTGVVTAVLGVVLFALSKSWGPTRLLRPCPLRGDAGTLIARGNDIGGSPLKTSASSSSFSMGAVATRNGIKNNSNNSKTGNAGSSATDSIGGGIIGGSPGQLRGSTADSMVAHTAEASSLHQTLFSSSAPSLLPRPSYIYSAATTTATTVKTDDLSSSTTSKADKGFTYR